MPADFALRRSKTPLGYIPDPSIEIRVLTKKGYVPFNFLVDSGADYTSLPMTFAEQLNVELDKSKPQIFLGMGKSSGKGYIGKITIQISQHPIDVRCAFMEDDATRPILGKVDIFSRYNILFDNKANRIRFSEI